MATSDTDDDIPASNVVLVSSVCSVRAQKKRKIWEQFHSLVTRFVKDGVKGKRCAEAMFVYAVCCSCNICSCMWQIWHAI